MKDTGKYILGVGAVAAGLAAYYLMRGAPDTGIVTGYVIDENSDGLSEVEVTCIGCGTVYSGADGGYALDAPSGSVEVWYRLDGYRDEVRTVNVVVGEEVEQDVTMIAVATGCLTGTVKDDLTGDPIVGATVCVDSTWCGDTDGNGNYLIEDIKVGDSLTVIATADGYQDGQATATIYEGVAPDCAVADFYLEPLVGPEPDADVALTWD